MLLLVESAWHLTETHLKILKAAETFIKTHNYVPERTLKKRANVNANFEEFLRDLIKYKFVQCFGNTFKLSISGFDAIAIHSLKKKGLVKLGTVIGVGKEADVYEGLFKIKETGKVEKVVLKFHRLGRSCYIRIAERNLVNEGNWFLINIESAKKEATFLEMLCNSNTQVKSLEEGLLSESISKLDLKESSNEDGGDSTDSMQDAENTGNDELEKTIEGISFENNIVEEASGCSIQGEDKVNISKYVPKYYTCNRHVVVMEDLHDYDVLYKFKIDNPEVISKKMLEFLRCLWDMGYSHGDFNEFNVMVSGDNLKVIDFPQCIPNNDSKALSYLKRDVECVYKYFMKKNFYKPDVSLFKGVLKE